MSDLSRWASPIAPAAPRPMSPPPIVETEKLRRQAPGAARGGPPRARTRKRHKARQRGPTSIFCVSADRNARTPASGRERGTQFRRIAVPLRALVFVGLVLGSIPAMAFAGERPVVVELFTSQGCSSCPPANAFLNEISRGRSDVLPLAFHVTYWDRLGWKDPFSLEAATVRQEHYGHRFGDGSYTPEMVVDGMVGLVGSHRSEVNAAIEHAKRSQHTATEVNVDKAGENVAIRIGSGVGRGIILLIGFDNEHRTK